MKALIIGLLSFAVVAAVGGTAATRYLLSEAPVFGASYSEQSDIQAKPFVARTGAEQRTSVDARAVSAASPAAEDSASSLSLAPKLEVTEHLDATGGASSAELRFKDRVIDDETAIADVKKAPEAARPEGRVGAVASSVHYGVRNRSELMARANGSVSNFKGGGRQANLPVGKLAGALADIQKQLDAAPLAPEEQAKLKKELDPLSKNVAAFIKDEVAQ